MRAFLFVLTGALLAQTPAPKQSTPATKAPATGAPATKAPAKAPAKAPTTATPKPAGPPPLTTDDQKTIYALGLSLARSIGQFDLSPAEVEIVKRAIADAAAG